MTECIDLFESILYRESLYRRTAHPRLRNPNSLRLIVHKQAGRTLNAGQYYDELGRLLASAAAKDSADARHKAAHGKTGPKRPESPNIVKLDCTVCGARYEVQQRGKVKPRVYCSNACRHRLRKVAT